MNSSKATNGPTEDDIPIYHGHHCIIVTVYIYIDLVVPSMFILNIATTGLPTKDENSTTTL